MDIRCRRITDLANCQAAFQGTRFQNLFPPALWPGRFFRSVRASSAPVLSPREKLAMLETVVEGSRGLNDLNKVDYTLSTTSRSVSSHIF